MHERAPDQQKLAHEQAGNQKCRFCPPTQSNPSLQRLPWEAGTNDASLTWDVLGEFWLCLFWRGHNILGGTQRRSCCQHDNIVCHIYLASSPERMEKEPLQCLNPRRKRLRPGCLFCPMFRINNSKKKQVFSSTQTRAALQIISARQVTLKKAIPAFPAEIDPVILSDT